MCHFPKSCEDAFKWRIFFVSFIKSEVDSIVLAIRKFLSNAIFAVKRFYDGGLFPYGRLVIKYGFLLNIFIIAAADYAFSPESLIPDALKVSRHINCKPTWPLNSKGKLLIFNCFTSNGSSVRNEEARVTISASGPSLELMR